MEGAMDTAKILAIDVRVELCCGNIGVPQHLLHGTQVGPTLQQMGGE